MRQNHSNFDSQRTFEIIIAQTFSDAKIQIILFTNYFRVYFITCFVTSNIKVHIVHTIWTFPKIEN